MPSPEGKVARREPGRMRNGDAVGYGMQSVKMAECLKFRLFNYLHSGFQMSPFLISQACRPASFPPGEAIAPAALSALNNNLSVYNHTKPAGLRLPVAILWDQMFSRSL